MTGWKAVSPPGVVRFLVLWECQVVKRKEKANEQGGMAAAVGAERKYDWSFQLPSADA